MKLTEIMNGEVGFPEPVFNTRKSIEFFPTLKAWLRDENDGVVSLNRQMAKQYEVYSALSVFWGIELDTELDAMCKQIDWLVFQEPSVFTEIKENGYIWETTCGVISEIEDEVRAQFEVGKVLKDGIEKTTAMLKEQFEKFIAKIPDDLDKKTLLQVSKNLGKEIANLNPEVLELLKKVGK